MTLLVTGAAGQLGRALKEVASGDVVPTFHREPDGRGFRMPVEDRGRVEEVVDEIRPDAVVHAAALTDVDACERDPERAREVNARGAGFVADAADEAGARLVYVSTDYVFDGERGGYREEDEPDPVNAYGRTKLEGERQVQERHDAPYVVRTSVVYGPHRPNFVTWMIDQLRDGAEIQLVEDQIVSPTYSLHLASQILALLDRAPPGTYHAAGADALSRFEMGEIAARRLDLDDSLIEPIPMSDLGWDAPRPRNSSLAVEKIDEYAPSRTFAEGVDALADARTRVEEAGR